MSHPRRSDLVNIPFLSNGYWSGLGKINGMNERGDAVGQTATRYGDSHAILLLKE